MGTLIPARRWRGLWAVALVLALLLVPAPALAAPTTNSAEIEVKKAERAAALAGLDRKRTELDAQVAEYVSIGHRIERTKVEIAQVTSETAELDLELANARATLADRAAELYRRDKTGLIEVLLASQSAEDLLVRAEYLVTVGQRDALMLDEVRRLQYQSRYLKGSLSARLQGLITLQTAADTQRVRIVNAMTSQQAKAKTLETDIAKMMRDQESRTFTGSDPTARFTPDTVISEMNFRASASMTPKEIQLFLDRQPGTLKSYTAKDHTGTSRSAAAMIAEASAAWGISPKVILVTLQKEQSLLAKTNPTAESYDWAMGCGKADSRTYYEYQGFGKQVWFGAYKLRKNADLWHPGATQDIDGSVVRPTNPGTHAQYRYTPHFTGVMSFWMLYWRYFGDPLT